MLPNSEEYYNKYYKANGNSAKNSREGSVTKGNKLL
jgi:hypothetical protein